MFAMTIGTNIISSNIRDVGVCIVWLYSADLMMFSAELGLGIVNIVVDTYIDTNLNLQF
jgi:hypothetical protein